MIGLQANSHAIAERNALEFTDACGIFLIELGVGITVSAVMILVFFYFAGRGRTQ